MRDTLHVPFWEKGRYIGIASVKALRGIKNDPDFAEWRKYLTPGDVLYNSEVGTVEQIRFIECNNTSALSNAVGTGSVLGEAVIFGQDAVALAEAQTPELRAAIPGNFGLWKAVAWYGVLAFGLIWDATATAGEARVVRVCSS
jgi:N4-gp56 family major capsid protein